MKEESGETYIEMLNIKPENGNNELSKEQLKPLQEYFSNKNLNDIKDKMTVVLRAKSEDTKQRAGQINNASIIDTAKQEQIRTETRELADKWIRVFQNLGQIAQALNHSLSSESPTRSSSDEEKRNSKGSCNTSPNTSPKGSPNGSPRKQYLVYLSKKITRNKSNSNVRDDKKNRRISFGSKN